MSPLTLLSVLLLVCAVLADVNDEVQENDRGVLQLTDEGIPSASGVKRARNPYSWMVNEHGKRSRNPYSWMAHQQGKRSVRYADDIYRQPRNPYSWLYTMFDKRARNPYSWMNE